MLKPADTSDDPKKADKYEDDIVYKLEDVPPWHLSIILGVQHYLTMFSGAIAIPFIISSDLCMEENSPYRGHIISTTLFTSGIATLLQSTLGCRLPIIQGPSLSFLIPTLAILSLPQWKCPSVQEIGNMTEEDKGELWMSRMREVQGAIIVGSVIEVLVGLTGLIGFLMKWITPLSIAPTITLIGLSLFTEAARQSSGNWGIASLTIILLIVFSQYLAQVNTPAWGYSKRKGCHFKWFPFFKLFPVLLAIVCSWGLCAILTASNALSANSPARTDLKISALRKAPWIQVPYPGQFGKPTFNIGPALGVIAGVVSSAVESVGDYYACAKLSGAAAPPIQAVNRGIMVEGIGCIIAGVCGTGSGLTSFSQNIGAIAITKVGSRRVIQFAAVIITIFGMSGKFGMLFVSIPTPVMGGIFCVMFAIITGVGLSNLQHVNMNSSRNIFIIGFSVFMGVCIPNYLGKHPDAIQTGNDIVDQICSILLKTSMFVGGFLGCFLDNTIPGTDEERGIIKWRAETTQSEGDLAAGLNHYKLPFGMEFLSKIECLKYVPICPTYDSKSIVTRFSRLTRKKKTTTNEKKDIDTNVLHV